MNEGGRIINISSTITAMMLPTYSAYVATKRAVEQVTRVLAKEVGNRGITVNVVSPGLTDTPLFREGIVIPINYRSASKMLALQIMCFLFEMTIKPKSKSRNLVIWPLWVELRK